MLLRGGRRAWRLRAVEQHIELSRKRIELARSGACQRWYVATGITLVTAGV